MLTENGRYRLRGFRKNEYTNVIDGQLIVTGAALIFNREFNKFSELFNPLKEEDKEDVDVDKEDADKKADNEDNDKKDDNVKNESKEKE